MQSGYIINASNTDTTLGPLQAGTMNSGLLQIQTVWPKGVPAPDQAARDQPSDTTGGPSDTIRGVRGNMVDTAHRSANSSWPALVDFGFREEVTVSSLWCLLHGACVRAVWGLPCAPCTTACTFRTQAWSPMPVVRWSC